MESPVPIDRDTMPKRTRRHFSPADKLRAIRLHHLEKKPVSEICEREDITPTLFYSWQKALFEGGEAAFEKRPKTDPRDRKISTLKEELDRKVAVIGELAQELVEAKKPLGGS